MSLPPTLLVQHGAQKKRKRKTEVEKLALDNANTVLDPPSNRTRRTHQHPANEDQVSTMALDSSGEFLTCMLSYLPIHTHADLYNVSIADKHN
jgi:hypothetical protein